MLRESRLWQKMVFLLKTTCNIKNDDHVHITLYVTLMIENISWVSLKYEIKGKLTQSNWQGKLEKSGDVLTEKKVTLP